MFCLCHSNIFALYLDDQTRFTYQDSEFHKILRIIYIRIKNSSKNNYFKKALRACTSTHLIEIVPCFKIPLLLNLNYLKFLKGLIHLFLIAEIILQLLMADQEHLPAPKCLSHRIPGKRLWMSNFVGGF